MRTLGLIDHLLAFALGLALPLGAALSQRRGAAEEVVPLGTREKISIYWVNSLVLALLGGSVVAASAWQGRPLAELGLRAPERPLSAEAIWTIVLLGLAYALDLLFQVATPERLERARAEWRRRTPFLPANRREFAHSLVLCLAAGVGEELVFRGFLIRYVSHFSGGHGVGLAVAILSPAVLFAVGHFYQGAFAALKVIVLAAGLGLIFVWTGSLLIPIAIHVGLDVVGMALGAWLMRTEAAA